MHWIHEAIKQNLAPNFLWFKTLFQTYAVIFIANRPNILPILSNFQFLCFTRLSWQTAPGFAGFWWLSLVRNSTLWWTLNPIVPSNATWRTPGVNGRCILLRGRTCGRLKQLTQRGPIRCENGHLHPGSATDLLWTHCDDFMKIQGFLLIYGHLQTIP